MADENIQRNMGTEKKKTSISNDDLFILKIMIFFYLNVIEKMNINHWEESELSSSSLPSLGFWDLYF